MSYKLKGKGIYVFSDPAGANSVLALVDSLIQQGEILGSDFVVLTNPSGVYSSQYSTIVKEVEFNEEQCAKIINDFKPDFLFSATSLNDYEHCWRKLCIKTQIHTISFIDHWTNYVERFSFNNEVVFGDEIWVVNEVAKREAILNGIPIAKLKAIGNPYYEKVEKYVPKLSKSDFLNSIRADQTKKIILFVSDDVKRAFPKDSTGKCILGYDEYTVLEDVFVALSLLERDIDWTQFQLVIKLHPRDEVNKFDELISAKALANLKVICIQKCDPLAMNYYSDYVLGMFSNMIVESLLMGKKVLRVQTGQKGGDLLKFDIVRSEVCTDIKHLNNYILNLFSNHKDHSNFNERSIKC